MTHSIWENLFILFSHLYKFLSTTLTLKDEHYKIIAKLLSAVLVFLLFYIFSLKSAGDRPECKIESDTNDISLFVYILKILSYILIVYNARYFVAFVYREWNLCELTKKDTIGDFDYKDYFFYRIDYLFSKNPRFKAMATLWAAIFVTLIGGFLWCIGTGQTLSESIWTAWTYVADPGTHAENRGIIERLVSFSLTLGGMVIFAVVIGIVSDDISTSVDNLRKGKSRVVVNNHTLILGQVSPYEVLF